MFSRYVFLSTLLALVFLKFNEAKRVSSSPSLQYISFNSSWTIENIQYLHEDVYSPAFFPKDTEAENNYWKMKLETTEFQRVMQPRFQLYANKISPDKNVILLRADWKAKFEDIQGNLIHSCENSELQLSSRDFSTSSAGGSRYWDCKTWELKIAITEGLPNDTLIVKLWVKARFNISKSSGGVLDLTTESPCPLNDVKLNLIKMDLILGKSFVSLPNGNGTDLMVIPKTLIAAESPAFAKLLAGARTLENGSVTLQIADVDFATMRQILKYVYTLEDDIDSGMEMKVFLASTKYEISNLQIFAERALGKILTIENVLQIWEISKTWNAERLQEIVIKYLRAKIDKMSFVNFKNLLEVFLSK